MGKGSKQRPTDKAAFDAGYDRIFKSKYTKQPWAKLYQRKAWKVLRSSQLASKPICEYCEAQGYLTLAGVVDHIIPHKGDELLFHDPENLRSLCKKHHDSTKQREENQKVVIGGNIDGSPIDPNHHWSK